MRTIGGWTALLMWALLMFAMNTPALAQPMTLNDRDPVNSGGTVQRDMGRLESTVKALGERVEKLSSKLEDAEKSLQEAKNNLIIAVVLISTGIAAVVGFSRDYIRRRVGKIAAQSHGELDTMKREFWNTLENSLNERFGRLDTDVTNATEQAVLNSEAKAYQYIHVATLRYAQKYDEALAIVGWNGDPKTYGRYPEAVQRHLISCLTKAHKVKENGDHLKAWDWVTSLMNGNPCVDNIEAMLRTAKELRHAADAVALYDTVCGKIGAQEQARCEQFLIVILRKSQGDSVLKARLQQLADKHRNSSDIRTQTTIAAVYRDEGRFEDADSIMKPAIKRLTGFIPRQEGWDKLFNTYIANCVDLDKPADAVPQVKTLLASFSGPDHVFNCARVAWRLPQNNPSRDELFRLIRVRFDDGLMPEKDDGTIKTLALLKALNRDIEGAESTLNSAIEDMANRGSSPWARDQVYFYRCALAELLLEEPDKLRLEKAIEALAEPVIGDRNGEASYLMAKAMIKKGEQEPARRSLEAAAKIKQKWIKRAKSDSAFDAMEGRDSLVSKYTAPLIR